MSDTLNKFAAEVAARTRATRPTRWVRFGIVAAIFVAWVIWLNNYWVLLALPLLYDIYITHFIPFTWWKHSKSRAVRTVMSWVDAIVYALILVYFVFTFVGQNYQIPTGSLEKTLLAGDYLWVNKMSYGPRVPMTPIHFPLVQNTLPILNTKSYVEWPNWKYHRLKGLGNVQTGDIVVFNFPAGDTVAVKVQNPDYYTLVRAYGRDAILAHPEVFGEVIYRPVDRRENYVKRAVGLPGETLKITDGQIYIDGKKQPMPADAQFNYYVLTDRTISESEWEQLGVARDDRRVMGQEEINRDYFKLGTAGISVSEGKVLYNVPLTAAMTAAMKALPGVKSVTRVIPDPEPDLFPQDIATGWTRDNYGPLSIPKKGMTVKLTAENWPLYERIIRNYEYHTDSYVKDGRVYVDGKPADSYTFEMDYYFMMGDNRDNSLDSRYWGFVPEDHIVGKPMRVLVSFDKDKSIFDGGIRWNRILKDANSGF